MIVFLLYVAIFAAAFGLYRVWERKRHHLHDFASLKTVTFGDESAVSPNRFASVISIIALFGIWGAFTGSAITPLHVPGPFVGDTSFTYTARNAAGETDDATVFMRVYRVGEDVPLPETSADQPGFAVDDALKIGAWRSALARPHENDIGGEDDGYSIIAIDGQPIAPDGTVRFSDGEVTMTSKGSLSIKPDKGWQMEPIWLPAPEAVVSRLVEIANDGYKNVSLWNHLGSSLGRVVAGFVIGSIIGIPLGYAMGLSNWFRGWFDPIVEFMRPVPPLALIPLIIIWFGIGEQGKVILLFLAALWIMTISARAGVSGVRISKVHAAYSLGASKWQILRHVIVPNSLPEIFTGARVAMGVCWGTVVAAELVAADRGAGMMIVNASKFQLTDIVILGIILIGIIGYGIDILMRMAEKWLVPWKGRG
ncbi:MAG: ABC transporter permease subunit [Hoeflea sp.]|uniref:ABC transporter permease n=1 Tax=Hoeflea sp. TaxID=1940281 RepID=UPI001D6AA1F1|nr:ABC transporter permease subunit [Hoeflea sp.]MBU4531727.1 ABC transporter permease subunit [Alphaproteobacteria bacterium]MBU4544583.1 ABC transporter permease subunit [Alphaproteobacteria bacterium]MBU4552814.1 ABC transporter permease subunit [Alphaproteobacteria bacterium]MBV1725003.1 ABC transporter permease subunit [Hoeflea sp.]MBV1761023.1 ABC transporter permease subunit [Hoeflea sp.]